MCVRIVQRRRRKMTEMVILHHLVWRGHWVMRRRVWIHGDGMIARQAVRKMAGDTTVRHRVRDRWSGRHDEGQI